jgi:pentose-5-phosphate-3-epimerase
LISISYISQWLYHGRGREFESRRAAHIYSSLKKIELLAQLRESRGLNFHIEVDGGVHHDTIADMVRAGAEILVAGSAIFEHGNPRESARQLLQSACAAAQPLQTLSLEGTR